MRHSPVTPWRPAPEIPDAQRIARAHALQAMLAGRRSCRAFSDRAVPRAIIEAAIAAAVTAPSGANRQPWHFCAIESREAKAAIRVAYEQEERRFYGGGANADWLEALWPLGTSPEKPYFETAPWLIVAFGVRKQGDDPAAMSPNHYVTESVSIACGLLLATLQAAHLATLVHTPLSGRFLNRVCRRPEMEKPVMVIVTGHAAADATVPASALEKKPLEQIASWL